MPNWFSSLINWAVCAAVAPSDELASAISLAASDTAIRSASQAEFTFQVQHLS